MQKNSARLKPDLVLLNAHVFTANDDYRADIEIQGDIAAIVTPGKASTGKEEIDLDGKPLVPGLIDAHVHLCEPGFAEREGFISGTRAAAAGGITLLADMPIANLPPVTDGETLKSKARLAEGKLYTDLYLLGGITSENLESLPEFIAEGTKVAKGFTVDQLKDFPCLLSGALRDGIERASRAGLTVALHCEDNNMVEYRNNKVKKQNAENFLDVFTPEAEILAVQNAIYLAEKIGAKLHILHASLADTIELVNKARQRGVEVTVETTLHHLLLTKNDIIELGPVAKCTPPPRDEENRERLWEMLLNDRIDLLGSDHSPSTLEAKFEADNFFNAWGGIQSVQYTVQLLLHYGVHKRGLSLNQLVRLLAEGPVELLGLPPARSSIQVGSEATFTALDLDKEWEITENEILMKNKHTPYLGWKGKGRAVKTIIRGEIVDIEGDPGAGRVRKAEAVNFKD